jgi:hypothetical protein
VQGRRRLLAAVRLSTILFCAIAFIKFVHCCLLQQTVSAAAPVSQVSGHHQSAAKQCTGGTNLFAASSSVQFVQFMRRHHNQRFGLSFEPADYGGFGVLGGGVTGAVGGAVAVGSGNWKKYSFVAMTQPMCSTNTNAITINIDFFCCGLHDRRYGQRTHGTADTTSAQGSRRGRDE